MTPKCLNFVILAAAIFQASCAGPVSGASYLIVSPDIGATRGTSAVVTPAQTTTYTLYATNAFGRTTATANITVQ